MTIFAKMAAGYGLVGSFIIVAVTTLIGYKLAEIIGQKRMGSAFAILLALVIAYIGGSIANKQVAIFHQHDGLIDLFANLSGEEVVAIPLPTVHEGDQLHIGGAQEAISGESGVVGPDERKGAKICACEFPSIKGGKPFNVRKGSFRKMLSEIGQPKPRKKRTAK